MTAERQPNSEQLVPPDTFIEQVKQTLEHLFDFPYLQRHPLAQAGQLTTEPSTEAAAQRLRRELLAAIETLSPGTNVPFRSPHARLYHLLHLHYVEGLTIQETANELGISTRQAYRDLRRSEESVAAVLWARRATPPPPEPRATSLSSIQAEMDRLDPQARPTDARLLLEYAQKAVDRLATQRSVHFQVDLPGEPVIVSTDPVVAQQVLVNMLSFAVQHAQPGTLKLELAVGDGDTLLVLTYQSEADATADSVINHMAAQLADRLGWTIRHEHQAGPSHTLTLSMPVTGPTVLVIDDNEGLVELLSRYLTGQTCRVTAATSGQEGLHLAQELLPDAIILDVMMPEMDGWEFLQRLRARPKTANIPVIICSVFNDPELAYSLGASLFMPKPVSRDNVLTALRQLGVV